MNDRNVHSVSRRGREEIREKYERELCPENTSRKVRSYFNACLKGNKMMIEDLHKEFDKL
jgi:hypothetical protein